MNELRRRLLTAAPFIVALSSFVVLLLAMPRDLGMFDESIVLTDALRVLHGDVVHRDFYSVYGPGQYYAVAALFGIFGKHFLVARVYDLAIRAATIGVLFHILAKRTSFLVALLFTGIGGLWLASIGYYLYPVFPCLLLALVATHLTSSAAERPSISWKTIAAGACAGVTALIRYDVGFFLLIANLATIVVLVARSTAEARSRRVLAALVAYVAGTAAVFLPAALTFLMVSPVRPFANDIVDYSLKYYRAMRGLPFPGLRNMRKNAGDVAVYLPVLAVGLAMAAFVLRPRGRSPHATAASLSNDSVPYLLAFTATAGMLFLKGMVRVSPVHMTLAIVSSLIVLAILVEDWRRRGAPLKIAAAVLVLLAAEPAARSMAHELRLDVQDPTRTVAGWLLVREPGEGSPAAGGFCEQGPASGLARLGSDYARVATFIARHTQPGEPVLVALNRHDKVFINPIGLYFAAARPPATHWHQFDPGMQTRADIQTAMIGELERRHVRLVVRDATDEGASEPNGSAVSSRVFLLDRYLASHYRAVAASGPVSVWFLKGETPVAYGPRRACEASPS